FHSQRTHSTTKTRSQTLAPITLRPIPIDATRARPALEDFLCALCEDVPRRTLEYRDELHVTKPVLLGQGDPGAFELSVYPCPAFHEPGRRLGRPDPRAHGGGEALLYLGPVHHPL